MEIPLGTMIMVCHRRLHLEFNRICFQGCRITKIPVNVPDWQDTRSGGRGETVQCEGMHGEKIMLFKTIMGTYPGARVRSRVVQKYSMVPSTKRPRSNRNNKVIRNAMSLRTNKITNTTDRKGEGRGPRAARHRGKINREIELLFFLHT